MEKKLQTFSFKAVRCKAKLSTGQRFYLIIPTKNAWNQNKVELLSGCLKCYTDDSHNEKSAGPGILIENLGIQRSFALGKHSTVFQTAIYAIIKAAE